MTSDTPGPGRGGARAGSGARAAVSPAERAADTAATARAAAAQVAAAATAAATSVADGARRGADPASGRPEWRIDDLAQRSGVSVDTIRFYQREGLLEAPTRRGRTAVYGPAHLHRLEQIRELQSRHLSLAAIRGLLESERIGLAESLFAAGEGDYTPSQLAAHAGVDRALLDELEHAGLLRPPSELGRESYDDADARLLAAISRMLDLGLPRPLVVRLGEIYATHFARMQEQVLELFTRGGDDVLAGEDMAAFHEHIAGELGEILKPVQAMLDYVHTRSVQTMTVRALERSDEWQAAPTRPTPVRRVGRRKR